MFGEDVGICPKEDGNLVAVAMGDDLTMGGVGIAADDDGGRREVVQFGNDAMTFAAFGEVLGEMALSGDSRAIGEIVPRNGGRPGE